MLKILQVCNVDFTVRNLLLPLIDRLKSEGYEVHISCTKGKISEELEKKGYIFKYVNIKKKIAPISNILSIISLYKIMKSGNYDIVHVHTPIASVLGRIAAKFAHVPIVIYTAHGFYFHDNMPKLIYNLFMWIEKLMGRYFTDYIFTQSYEDYNTAISSGIIKKNKIKCIGNGVNIDRFNPENVIINIDNFKEKLEIPIDSKVLCFVGRLVREKGILDLLEAFKYLVKDYKNIYLMIVGNASLDERDLNTKQKIDSYLKEWKFKNRIILTGLRNNIPELLKISDIFILPSYREGMPRSIIEAMAMSKPVIATNIRGCREEVIDNETGLLINVNSPKEIYEAIKKLLDNENLIIKYGDNGRKRAEMLYNEEKVLDKELKIIKSLLNNIQ